MITKDQLKEKLLEFLENAKIKGDLKAGMTEYLNFIHVNYKELDTEAQEIGNKAFEAITEMTQESLEKMPDGIEKRKIDRLHKKVWDARDIIDTLESKTYLKESVLKETEELFFLLVQIILDFLHDVMKNPLKGSELASLALFGSILEELMVAFHLAQHGYGPQSFSHQRVAYEAMDKIKVFEKHPELIDKWANDKLYRSEIREKLGKDSSDPIFELLSEMGSHPTMKNIQSRVFTQKTVAGEQEKARIWLGGSPRLDTLIFSNTGVIQVLMGVTISVVEVYGKYLLPEEVNDRIENAFEKYRSYMLKNFCDWMETQGKDVAKMIDFLTNFKIPKK